MTDYTPAPQPMPAPTSAGEAERLEVECAAAAFSSSDGNHHSSDALRQHNNDEKISDTRKMGGRTRLEAPTREIERMAYLLRQLRKKGTTQADISRLTGIKQSYLSTIERYEQTGAMSIGAEIVRLMQDRMGIGTGYFFDDYKGERSHTDYSLASRREDRDRDEMKLNVAELRVQFSRVLEELAALRSDFATERREHAETRRALAEAQSRKPRPVR